MNLYIHSRLSTSRPPTVLRGRRSHRAGMTLLEVMLALALMVLVIIAIGMAIQMNLRTLNSRRSNVEEAQLARAVLRMIADDLRSAVQYEAIDFSGAQQAASGATGGAAGAAGIPGMTGGIGGTSGGGSNFGGTGSTFGGIGSGVGGTAGGRNGGNTAQGNNALQGRNGPQSSNPQSTNQPQSQSQSQSQNQKQNQQNNSRGSGTSGPGSQNPSGSRATGGGGTVGGFAGRGGSSFGAGSSGGRSMSNGTSGSSGAGGTGQNTAEIATTEQPPDVPGLYGNQHELMVDVSRLPRLDEYSSIAAPGGDSLVNIPSDVKTVAYYVKSNNGATAPDAASSGRAATVSQGGTGLIRRQLARAVTKYASGSGNSSALNNTGDVVAPEVTAIEFSYYDGSAWASEWDSTQTKSLPLAVEINVTIRPPPRVGVVKSGQSDPDLKYRLVVHLPVAQLPPPEEPPAEGGTEGSSP